MGQINPFVGLRSPPPQLSERQAAHLSADVFGVQGRARRLGSHQDLNVRIDAADGAYVLKVANQSVSAEELDLQNAAMRHVAAALAREGLAVPTAMRTPDGTDVVSTPAQSAAGGSLVRLLTFLDGDLLSDAGFLSAPVLRGVGRTVAATSLALADFDHPAADRVLQWDPRRASHVVDALVGAVAERQQQELVVRVTEAAARELDLLAPRLRQQVIHADLADYNLVARRGPDGRPLVSGVIDFGDVVRSWLVGDLATAATSLLGRPRSKPVHDVAEVVAGFHERRPLLEPEVAAVWPLVCARAAVLAVTVEHQLGEDPSNRYLLAERGSDWSILERVAAVDARFAEEVLRARLGLPLGRAARAAVRWVADVDCVPWCSSPAAGDDPQEHLDILDLGIRSPALTPPGWDVDLAAGRTHVSRYGEARLSGTRLDSIEAPRSVHLSVGVRGEPGREVRTPVSGVLAETDDGVRVRAVTSSPSHPSRPDAELELRIRGVLPEGGARAVSAGEVIGKAEGEVRLQVVAVPGLDVPEAVTAADARGWRRLCPDPSRLLGVPAGVPDSSARARHVVARRAAVVAGVQESYYQDPPQIERGWRSHLFDTDARAYLDMVNNVAVLGHSHPAVTEAATRQLSMLNTNSRFVYDIMVELAERVVALLPSPLDTVLFVSSGSEAVDLALRLVRTATGRQDVLCLRGGYHGWTTATDEISTALQDNPNAAGTRPPWVHPLPMPNRYRGEHRLAGVADEAAAEWYLQLLRLRLEALGGAGRAPAAFVAEPLSGNAGGVELPPGYLAGVYDAVRGAGGLCVADEVQVGYGRLGSTFWGFEEHGVVPDVVTMAKAAGNGYPLGYVVTRRELAETFASQGSFFSSVGGSPVSCAVGVAVLDTLRDEALQANAASVGHRLQQRLGELVGHSLVGHVHGHGLYQGVELVQDLTTRAPATAEAAAVCERLLELGVICQPTGDFSNVLKVKPPLSLTEESADFFVDVLAEVLLEGW